MDFRRQETGDKDCICILYADMLHYEILDSGARDDSESEEESEDEGEDEHEDESEDESE